jgi:DNA-binding transcriptional ArsR family regulator
VLERLSRSHASVSELAAPFHIALPSFVSHLAVLGDCGLVRSKKTAAYGPIGSFPTDRDAATRKRHEEMGFYDGWSKVLDQLVGHVKTI